MALMNYDPKWIRDDLAETLNNLIIQAHPLTPFLNTNSPQEFEKEFLSYLQFNAWYSPQEYKEAKAYVMEHRDELYQLTQEGKLSSK